MRTNGQHGRQFLRVSALMDTAAKLGRARRALPTALVGATPRRLGLKLMRMVEGQWLLALAIGIASGPLAAGGSEPPATTEKLSAVSLAFDLQPIFDTYCVQCHLLESAQGGLVLENGEAWSNLVNTDSTQAALKRVAPGNPGASYLLHKLRGTHVGAGGSGQMMPFGDPAGIGNDSVKLIERWVGEGAMDN